MCSPGTTDGSNGGGFSHYTQINGTQKLLEQLSLTYQRFLLDSRYIYHLHNIIDTILGSIAYNTDDDDKNAMQRIIERIRAAIMIHNQGVHQKIKAKNFRPHEWEAIKYNRAVALQESRRLMREAYYSINELVGGRDTAEDG